MADTTSSFPRAEPVTGPPKRNPVLIVSAIVGVVLLALVLFGGGKFLSVFNGNYQPLRAADGFFKLIAKEGPDSAYATASPAFRAAVPLALWETTARSWNLANYSGYDWDNRDVTTTTARFQGRLHLLSGGDLPATVYLRKEGGNWRVASVNASAVDTPAGLSGTTTAANTPPPDATPAPAAPAPSTPSGLAAGEMPGSASPATPAPSAPQTITTPDGTYAANQSAAPQLGRAGPPGTYLPKGAIAMQCLSPLARIGFRADRIDCGFTRMETIPGRQGHCTAYTPDGRSMNTTLTFVDYDPVTGQGRFDCRVD